MASPTYTGGSAGNGRASASLAANGTANFDVDVSAAFEARVQVGATYGSVSATAGLKIEVFELVGSTPVADTVPGSGSILIPAVASTSQAATIHLQTGKYRFKLSNTDGSNGLTAVYATYDLTPAVS